MAKRGPKPGHIERRVQAAKKEGKQQGFAIMAAIFNRALESEDLWKRIARVFSPKGVSRR